MNIFDSLKSRFGGAQQGGVPADLGVDGMGNTMPFVPPTAMAAPQIDGTALPNPWQNRLKAMAGNIAKVSASPQQNLGFPSAPPMQLQPLQQLQPSVHQGTAPQQISQPQQAGGMPVPPQLQPWQRPQGLLGR